MCPVFLMHEDVRVIRNLVQKGFSNRQNFGSEEKGGRIALKYKLEPNNFRKDKLNWKY